MKKLKVVAIILGVLLLGAVAGLVLLMTPAVQTWIVRKALPQPAGTRIELGRVAAGFSSGRVTGVKITQPGQVVTIDTATATYSLPRLLRGRLQAGEVHLEGVVLDLRTVGAPPAATSAAAAPSSEKARSSALGTVPVPRAGPATTVPRGWPGFNGLLSSAEVPMEFGIDRLTAKGRALLADGREATFEATGSNLGTGRDGAMDWTAAFKDSGRNAPLTALDSSGSLRFRIGDNRRVESVSIESAAAPRGPGLALGDLRLIAQLARATASGDETYTLTLGQIGAAGMEPLVKLTAAYSAAAKALAGDWQIGVRSEQLQALLARFGLPAFSATGTGKFQLLPATFAGSASGEIDARVATLASVSPSLAALGESQVRSQFEARLADGVIELTKVDLTAAAGGQQRLQATGLQRIAYDLNRGALVQASPGTELARLSIQALPLAWAQPFAGSVQIESGELSAVLTLAAEADTGRARLRTAEPIALKGVTVRQGERVLATQASLAAQASVDYAPDRISVGLTELKLTLSPDENLSGQLSAELSPKATSRTVAFAVALDGQVGAAIKPYLPVDVGPIDFRLNSEGRLEGAALQLAKATASVKRRGGADLLTIESRQPSAVALGGAGGELAVRVRLGQLPLAWANEFLTGTRLEGMTTGGVVDLDGSGLQRLTVTMVEPLTVRGLRVVQDGTALLQGVDLVLAVNASRREDVSSFEVTRIEARKGDVVVLKLDATGEARTAAGKMSVTSKGNLQADLAQLAQQPAASAAGGLSRGTVQLAFDGTYGDLVQGKVTLALRDLVAREGNRTLGNLDATAEVKAKPDGSAELAIPVVLSTGGRRSDVSIAGTFQRTEKGFSGTGRASGNELFVDDFMPLGGIFPKSTTAPAGSRAARDATPFWSGFNGRIEADLKTVHYGAASAIKGLKGVLVASDGRLTLEGIEGSLGANPFKVAGAVNFNAAQAKPYSLTGSANVTNFDLGQMLRAANPGERPMIEALVSVVAKLNGTGATLPDLMKGAYGQFEVSGSQGVLRALGRRGQVAGALSIGVGILGALQGSDTTSAVANLAAELNEMRFDRFSMQVDRGADLGFKLGAIEFISPSTRITGSGRIEHREGVELARQPMTLDLKLAGRDHMALLLRRAGLLGAEVDDKGFSTVARTFNITGTVGQPDSGAFWRLVTEAAVSGLLNR